MGWHNTQPLKRSELAKALALALSREAPIGGEAQGTPLGQAGERGT